MSLSSQRPTHKEQALTVVTTIPADSIIKININVKRSLYKKLKFQAVNNETTMTDIIIRAVETYVSI